MNILRNGSTDRAIDNGNLIAGSQKLLSLSLSPPTTHPSLRTLFVLFTPVEK